jgi:hypothetical protein
MYEGVEQSWICVSVYLSAGIDVLQEREEREWAKDEGWARWPQLVAQSKCERVPAREFVKVCGACYARRCKWILAVFMQSAILSLTNLHLLDTAERISAPPFSFLTFQEYPNPSSVGEKRSSLQTPG